MKYANSILELPNAFRAEPLEISELKEFYYDGTMEVRTADNYDSPITDIFYDCMIPSSQNAFLLLGHRGCGKSTELNEMSSRLQDAGYQVRSIPCTVDMDLLNPVYADLLILMGEYLLDIAREVNCSLSARSKQVLKSFWRTEIEQVITETEGEGINLDAGVEIHTPVLLNWLMQAFIKVKGDLKYSEEKRTTYRERISQHSRDWLDAMNDISCSITEKSDGKQPILIFEDLDKLDPEEAWKIFFFRAAMLTGVSFPVIYTFPIALSYHEKFAALEGYFKIKTLPMIKQRNLDGTPCEEGYETVRKIVEKRADLHLFEETALRKMIEKTGGSLRDLFTAINDCAIRARRRKSPRIEMEDADRALEKLKTSLTRRISGDHYDFLAEIYNGQHEKIEDREMLLKMLQANAVLEYNGKRWHDVHPLVADFLVEQGLT